ncbi:hypothetical protein B0I35DRAFT_441871, partial [Stachybotrys elegans]
TGCNKCRSRKVKCDERKPTCANCEKNGYAECRYRDEFERTWRIQTDNKNKNKTVKTQKQREQREPAETGSLKSVVFQRFLHDWAGGRDAVLGMSISWFGALPTMYADASPGGLLHTSIQALANANYGKRFGDGDTLRQSASEYGQVLIMLRETLPKIEVSTFQVLASIVMLGIYEALVAKSITVNGGWMSHMVGASMLLKREKKRLKTPLELQVGAMITRQTLHASLITGQELPIHLEQGPASSPLLKHIYTQTSLVHQAALLCTEWRQAFEEVDMGSSSGSGSGSGLEKLVAVAERALSLDRNLDEWSQHLPGDLLYTVEPTSVSASPAWLQALLQGPWAPQASHDYATGSAEIVWRFQWVARLILSQALLHTDAEPVAACRSQVEAGLLLAADRLCESCLSPFVAVSRDAPSKVSLEDVPSLYGYLMLQILPPAELCLKQVVVSHDLSGRQNWTRRMKAFLGQQMGYAKATVNVDPARYSRLPIQMWGLTSE